MLKKSFFLHCKAALISLLLLPIAALADPIAVTYTASPIGALMDYNLTITNNSLPDLLSVTLSTPAQSNAVQNLSAPTGFSAFFDPGLGLVDFVSNGTAFSVGSSLAGFRFQSPFQLGSTGFSALSLDANQNPVVTTGQVTNATTSPVPEPAFLSLIGAVVFSMFWLRKRKATDPHSMVGPLASD